MAAPIALAPLVDDFFAAGEVDQNDPETLHPMRLAGKKLRYAIELLSGAFDSRLRDSVYPQFSQIQEDLGAINDHLVAKTLFDRWLLQSDDGETDRELSKLIAQEDLVAAAGDRTFSGGVDDRDRGTVAETIPATPGSAIPAISEEEKCSASSAEH